MTKPVPRAAQRSPWRLMPAGIAGWLLLTAVVNAAMVAYALTTFPGEAGDNAFDISNSYDAVLQAAEQQARLGWTVATEAQDRRPVLHVLDRNGAALRGASVHGTAARPLGPAERTALGFTQAGDGTFVSDTELSAPGQWDIAVTVDQADRHLTATRRLVLR